MFKAAGHQGPPKTMSQLTADAKKLTQAQQGRLAQGRRLQPVPRLLRRNAPDMSAYAPLFGAKYVDGSGKSELVEGPGLGEDAEVAEEPRRLVRLQEPRQKFNAGAGDEFSASHAFEIGKLAMMIDGEWRVAFIAGRAPRRSTTARRRCRSTTPSRTSTAPATSTATIIGIPKGVKHKDAGVGAAEVPDVQRPRARAVLQRDPERSDDEAVARLEGAQAGRALQDVPDDLREPELEDDADHGGGQRVQDAVQAFAREVAGRAVPVICTPGCRSSTSRSTHN